MCEAGRNQGGRYTYPRLNRAYFPEYGSDNLGGISVGLGARYQSRKSPHFGCGQSVKQLLSFVIRRNKCWTDMSPNIIPFGLLRAISPLRVVFSELTMNQPMKLSLEQQFSICSFATQVQNMSHDQAKDFLVKLYEQMVVREATYQELLKHQWGLDSGSTMA